MRFKWIIQIEIKDQGEKNDKFTPWNALTPSLFLVFFFSSFSSFFPCFLISSSLNFLIFFSVKALSGVTAKLPQQKWFSMTEKDSKLEQKQEEKMKTRVQDLGMFSKRARGEEHSMKAARSACLWSAELGWLDHPCCVHRPGNYWVGES